ncbi:AAA family ATPase domain-containing protein [Desulfonema limicola]|uniref:AAA family ATPase domain-containing protein n=1 Tax=Desulfonema limicola TaxID=45656 RepID=A0A975BAC3_9BACT|nr:ATP-binding cassette domain-containing protein [Desulfonema limicola]QTA81500.1 AAA family ATPase domain-containing protein [Desulfonema limicola]
MIKFENISIRMGNRLILPDTSWEIKAGQNWAVTGPNGAGKSSLVRAVFGDVPVVRGKVIRHPRFLSKNSIGYVSFELHQHIIAQDENKDHARFFSRTTDNLTTAGQCLEDFSPDIELVKNIAVQMEILHLMDRPIRYLSTGEMRRMLIARAMTKSPELLILDEPFDGLDILSRKKLSNIISSLISEKMQIILITHRIEEILPEISHIIRVKDCRVIMQGKREDILFTTMISQKTFNKKFSPEFLCSITQNFNHIPNTLIKMKNVKVKYKDNLVFENLNWTVKKGENWAVTGPNGSGKTTLLSLISGDNPQAYANHIYLFGKKRGTGESIWEIKQHIGTASSEMQIRYRKSITAFDVILSGFYDSVGLYRNCSLQEKKTALNWIQFLGIEDKAGCLFNNLSYGEQRLIILARAMVKSPVLLILDEPCQGLDPENREMILKLIDFIGHSTKTNILYVSHHPDERPACISNTLSLPL